MIHASTKEQALHNNIMLFQSVRHGEEEKREKTTTA